MRPILVVMSGHAGSGKTTLARALAEPLAATVLSKDLIKEALYEPLRLDSDEASLAGSVAAIRLIYATGAVSGSNLIVEANWKPLDVPQLLALDRRIVQVVCRAPSEVLRRRVLERIENGRRHPVHRDRIVPAVRDRLLASLGEDVVPLELRCPVLDVDTAEAVAVGGVVEWIIANT